MRKSGKTTRKIDEAIQTLFELGEIIVLSKAQLLRLRKQTRKHIVDEDFGASNYVQEILFMKIIERLENEHPNQCTYNHKEKSIILGHEKD